MVTPMDQNAIINIFSQEFCETLLPPQTSDRFFEALYGDVSEGAYDIRLKCESVRPGAVELGFHLTQRPGKCLVCSLTYGLPKVFSRHPLIDIQGMIRKIKDAGVPVKDWRLGQTSEKTRSLHVIPFHIETEIL